MQGELSNSYAQNPLDNRADNLEKAIEYYQAALQVRTPEDMPVDWATTMNNLAIAYQNRLRGTRADNLEKAIEGYQAALQVITQKDMPVEWASTMNNLANAYSDRIRGTRADNLEKATETLYTLDEGSAEGLQAELAENQDLAARASYCLAKLGHFDEAIVTLEQGRTRAFSETYNATLLKMASETDQQTYTEASVQVKALEKEMYTAGQENTRSRAEVLADLKLARTRLATLVETIRQTMPDFLPEGLNFQSICQLATTLKQPLVYLLTTPKGSLALIVPAKGETEVVWLDDFSTEDLSGLLYDNEETRRYLHGTVGG
ncbi:TPR repeat-containing protein [Candidatus Thiomargarita nelsonii]|uniref:TPR repeat-containing protein n=1 Tax=Candidatus Thiomargarita nelsonii TaxID=1003181 RepID=A0A0A6RHH7_9GAMM|nr:TPR repeat-containing protein [Candidatus Thiomargarita nelsonii]